MIPEPKSFNGGPNETGGEIRRATGPKREPEGIVPPLRAICAHCHGDVIQFYTLADVGIFCSFNCREAATTLREAKKGAA